VLGSLEVADQVVVLEGRRGHKQRVQHHPEQGDTPEATVQP
jgi:hypothetical protein